MMIVLELNWFDMPPEGGKAFNHFTQLPVPLMIIFLGQQLQGVLWRVARHPFFTILTSLSISGTCSCAAQKLVSTLIAFRWSAKHQNSLSE